MAKFSVWLPEHGRRSPRSGKGRPDPWRFRLDHRRSDVRGCRRIHLLRLYPGIRGNLGFLTLRLKIPCAAWPRTPRHSLSQTGVATSTRVNKPIINIAIPIMPLPMNVYSRVRVPGGRSWLRDIPARPMPTPITSIERENILTGKLSLKRTGRSTPRPRITNPATTVALRSNPLRLVVLSQQVRYIC